MLRSLMCSKAICQNGPAEKSNVGSMLRDAGERMADPSEISHLRREVSQT